MAVRSVPWLRTSTDTISWRQDQAENATIYILRQTGPTGFLLKEEDNPKKFKVFLGDPHSCTCQDFRKEREGLCKHICWVILKKFRVPRQNPITWQRGLVDRELNEILRGLAARHQPRATTNTRKYASLAQKTADENGKAVLEQREIGEDDVCPICQDELLEKRLPVTFCKFGCGNSVHIKCMKVWAEHQHSQGKTMIECPFCREDFGPMNLLQQEFRNSGKEVRADRLNEHLGITCNKCHVCPIAGKCYKCDICAEFYLCQKCFNTPTHPDHAFSFRQRPNQRWRPAPRSAAPVLPAAIVQNLMNRDISDADYDVLLQLDSSTQEGGSDLTEDTIRLFPLERIRAGGLLTQPGQQCRACLRPYTEGQYVRKLPCGHKFHKECIDEWLLHRRPTCPVDGTTFTNQSVRVMMEANRQRSKRLAEESSRQMNSSGRNEAQQNSGINLEIPGIGIARVNNGQQNGIENCIMQGTSINALNSSNSWTSQRADNSQVRNNMGGFFGIFRGNASASSRPPRGRHGNSNRTQSDITVGSLTNEIDTILTHSRASSIAGNGVGDVESVSREPVGSLYGRRISSVENVHNMHLDTTSQRENSIERQRSQILDNLNHDAPGADMSSLLIAGTRTHEARHSQDSIDSNTGEHHSENPAVSQNLAPHDQRSRNRSDSGISSLTIDSRSEGVREKKSNARMGRRGSVSKKTDHVAIEPQPPSIPHHRATADFVLGIDGLTENTRGFPGRPPLHLQNEGRSVGRRRNRPLYREPARPRSNSRSNSRSREQHQVAATNDMNGASGLYIGHSPASMPATNMHVHEGSAGKARSQRLPSDPHQADNALALSGTTFSGGQ